MKLSFVIPAYNEAANIGKCIESILRESAGRAGEIEIVVVDNASSDGTGAIARQYPGVTVVPEPRKGITFARQAGLAEGRGDLIANVDADTMLTPGWIETVLEEFSQDPRLVCLSGPFLYYDASRWVRFWTRFFYWAGFGTYLVNRFLVRGGSMVQGGNFVCRKSALEAVGGFDTRIDFYGEDTDIARRLHRVGRVKWTFRLPVFASARRLAAEGVIATGVRYTLNYFWVLFFKRPFTKRSTDIRPAGSRGRCTPAD
jgi:glycosyltransferase involved in cell wall biosynthesis